MLQKHFFFQEKSIDKINVCKQHFEDTFSVFSQLYTWAEMTALCRLDENDIDIRDITDKIQEMALNGNNKITLTLPKVKTMDPWQAKM